jgi:hypothetical protein
LSVVPEFILNIDWGRWLAAMSFTQYVMVFLCVYHKYGDGTKAMEELGTFAKKYPVVIVCLLVYLYKLGNFDEGFMDAVNLIDSLH